MSLMHLLSVSPTFTDARNKADGYKVKSTLPKFAPVRRPVSLAPAKKPSREPVVQTSLFEEKTAVKPLSDKSITVARPVVAPEPVRETPVAVAQSEVPKTTAAPLEKKAKRVRPWKTVLKEFFLGKSRNSGAEKTVQTELALEQVTVVRNDLSDADLVVVSKASGSSDVPGDKREMAGLAWARLTGLFFKATGPSNAFEQPVAPTAAEVVSVSPAEEPKQSAEVAGKS